MNFGNPTFSRLCGSPFGLLTDGAMIPQKAPLRSVSEINADFSISISMYFVQKYNDAGNRNDT